VAKEVVSESKKKPVLDEQALGKLLEAAFVLQQHNREMQELELGLELKRDQAEAEDRGASPSLVSSRPSSISSESLASESAAESEPTAPADYTVTLAKIVETQHQIQVRHLELQPALELVVARVVEFAHGCGSAIAVADGRAVRYQAVAGEKTPPTNAAVPMEKSLSRPCLRTSQVFRCADINPEFLVDTEECRRRGIQSLIAVPIFHDGEVVGGLELYYADAHAFTDQDVHTCQLMAGLVTEALGREEVREEAQEKAREEEAARKKSLADERAAVLEALEKLQPNLEALVNQAAVNQAAAAESAPTTSASDTTASSSLCRRCGREVTPTEQFCGHCGLSRTAAYEPPSMQTKLASLWYMQEEKEKGKKKKGTPPAGEVEKRSPEPERAQEPAPIDAAAGKESAADVADAGIPDAELLPKLAAKHFPEGHSPEHLSPEHLSDEHQAAELQAAETQAGETEAAKTHGADSAEEESSCDVAAGVVAADVPAGVPATIAHPPDWSSAASARDFLEPLAPDTRAAALARFWNTRRGDIYLAIAVILVACVIRWGIWSSHSASGAAAPNAAAASRKPDPEADLSFFDRMLISLGLADPPEVPEDKGNPSTQVWVDLHTALYYCPGADLYGKTSTGKFTTQREAQLDQFEPAYRKTCN
jgi:hypothetical protein